MHFGKYVCITDQDGAVLTERDFFFLGKLMGQDVGQSGRGRWEMDSFSKNLYEIKYS